MSKLRECDRHGGSFSEKEEGWAQGNLIIHRRYADGSQNNESIQVDYCPACVRILEGITPEPQPQGRYTGGVWEGDKASRYPRELTSEQHGRPGYDPAYVAQMERQTLFDDQPGVAPKPGDKAIDYRDGSTKTVLNPEPDGKPCVCGVPTFSEHYHGFRPAEIPAHDEGTSYCTSLPEHGHE